MEGSSTLSPEHLAQHKHISTIRKLLDYYNNAPLMLDEDPDPDSLIAGLKNFVYQQSEETGGGCIISMKIRFLFLSGYEPLVEFGQEEKAFSKLLTSLPKILALNCSESMDKQLNTSQPEKVDQQKPNGNVNDKQNDNRILEAANSREILNDKTDSRAGLNVPIIAILESDTHHQNKDQVRPLSSENTENEPSPNNNYEEQFRNKVEDWLLNKNVENPESVEGNSTPNTERLMCERQVTPVDHQQESNESPNHPNNNQQQQLFQDPNSLNIEQPVNPLQCIYCNKICGRRQHLEIHLRNHTGERPFKCRFPNCSYTSTSENSCRAHENTKKHQIDRERERLEELSKSKNSTSKKRAEQQKTILALPEIPSWNNTMNEMTAPIEMSGESGKSNYNSSSENKDENSKVKNPLRCQFCFRKFFSTSSKDFHEKGCSKAPQTNNQLPSASNQLKTLANNNLQSSRKNAEQGNLEEETDDEEMQTSPPQIGNDTSLQSKTRARPQQWPVEARTCSYCNKIFQSRYFYLNHLRVHTGERPFQCSVCLKSFATKGYLVSHARIHTGEKPYPCTICGRRFTFSNGCKIHMLSVHIAKPQWRTQKSATDALNLQEESQNNSEQESNVGDEIAVNSRQVRKSVRTGNTEKNYDYYEDEEEDEVYFIPGRNSTKSKGHLECQMCGQNNFGYPSQLAAHIRCHTKPFNCRFCSGRFAEQRLCTRHENSCQAGTNREEHRIMEKRSASKPAQHVNKPKRLRMEKSSAASSSSDI